MCRNHGHRQLPRCGWALLPLLGVAACHSAATQRQQLASGNPLDRVMAAVWLAEAGDAQAVHTLVGLLEDQDRTVRMYAILALERLCGQTYGYRFYRPEAERAAAVARWREALRRGEVCARRSRPDQDATPPATRHHQASGGVGAAIGPRGEVHRAP